jgi:uncharacterized protein YndB with AHSA1/START domain
MVIRKTVAVAQPPPIAFRVFCEEIGQWWPLKQGFSFGGERAGDIFLEAQIGGRFYERFRDGTEFDIGRVLDYQPPAIVAFSWRSPRWEGETRVEVRFVADGAGTRVEMEHRGWEQSPKMLEAGKEYSNGWNFILAQFRKRVAPATGGE